MDKIRIDKWLWAARFYKTRSLATDEIDKGRVRINDLEVKPAKEVKVGDTVALRQGPFTRTLVVHGVSDKRGGANGARIRLSPQKDWEVNQPAGLAKVLPVLEAIQTEFNATQTGGKRVSLADLIVLGGCAAVQAAAKKGGVDVTVPFTPGRTDARQDQTDVESFAALEPAADGFRNHLRPGQESHAAALLVDKANLLSLTAPEMTVLVGGLRVLNANVGQSKNGVFTHRPETLSTDFFTHLLDMSTVWQPSATSPGALEGRDRTSNQLKWTATVVDLIFGSNAQLRAIAEVHASCDAQYVFVQDFVKAWSKVMNLDRFDLA